MANRKIKLAPGANPFDKSRSAAERIMYGDTTAKAPQAAASNQEEPVTEAAQENVGTVGYVGDVEQQSQHIQQVQQEKKADAPAKKEPRRFPGKQHIHLILPDEQADMIKALAKYSGLSVNQFMSSAIETLYTEKWKDSYAVIQQMQHKMGMDMKTSKKLF